MSELRRAINAAINEWTNDDERKLDETIDHHISAVVVPERFDVRRVAIAATGDVSEGGFVPVYAESVEQVNEALSMAAERANKMRERGDMFAEESRRKAGWLLGGRHLFEALKAQLLLAQEALIAAGFTQLSATNHWKPPLGKRLDFEAVDVIDEARDVVANLYSTIDPETRMRFLAAAIDRYDAMKRARELGAALGASSRTVAEKTKEIE
jgi:hypothetical protein